MLKSSAAKDPFNYVVAFLKLSGDLIGSYFNRN